MADLAEIYGIKETVIYQRMYKLGWSVPEAVGLLPRKQSTAGHNNNEGKETLRSQENQEDVHDETGT